MSSHTPKTLCPEDVAAILSKFSNFENLVQIARDYGLSERSVVYRVVDLYDPSAHTRRAQTRVRRFAEIRKRFAAGEKAPALATEYGISRQRIYQIRDGL